jgi:hypothetical protein
MQEHGGSEACRFMYVRIALPSVYIKRPPSNDELHCKPFFQTNLQQFRPETSKRNGLVGCLSYGWRSAIPGLP